MINSYQARQIADAWLNSPEVQITQVQTLPYGWVFFYQSKAYLAGDESAVLAGNAPLLVDRDTGKLVVTGTAHRIEVYLQAYEQGRSLLVKLGSDAAQIAVVDQVIDAIKLRRGERLLRAALMKQHALSAEEAVAAIEQVRRGLTGDFPDHAEWLPLLWLARERAALGADWPDWVKEAQKNGRF